MNTSDDKRTFFGLSRQSSVTAGRFWLAESSPGSLGTLILSIQSTVQATILLGLQTDSIDTSIEFQEAAITSGGSGVDFLNPNFNVSSVPAITLTGGVTIDTPGSVVWVSQVIGQGGQGVTPDSVQEAVGLFVLKANTNYAITITNNTTATDYVIDIGYIED